MESNDHYENGRMPYSMWVYTICPDEYTSTLDKKLYASRFFPNSVGPDRAPYLQRVIWAHIVCLCAMYGTKVEKKNILISDKGRGDDPGGMQPCVAFHPCLYCLP